MHLSRFIFLIFLLCSLVSGCNYYIEKKPVKEKERSEKDSPPTFTDIETILHSHCIRCHGSPEINADLDMTTYKSLMASGYVEANSPSQSTLYQMVKSHEMPPPPNKHLSNSQIEEIYAWIKAGCLEK